MANVAQLIRRQSSRELLRVPLDRLELRELQHRLLPTPSDQANAGPALYGTTNAAFVEDGSTPSSSLPSIIQQQVKKKNYFSYSDTLFYQCLANGEGSYRYWC